MTPQESKDLQPLLDAVLSPASGHCGPTCTEVLGLLRQESRRRRRRVHISMAAGVACMLVAMLCYYAPPPKTPSAALASKSFGAPPLVLRQVGEAQLFALLKDTPAALVKLPDGTERLLILQP
ncbi:hypothetical protein [Prosthecobacter fluviatilis]|uniref:Uncharacterized protein n=1 Tax=Prosthecobacter fluviatilis TaxID=445931 RepID=A0ABW0KIH5_9BACT